MATTIRTRTSERGIYHISTNRYLELKHFCLQYDEWRQQLTQMDICIRGYCIGDRIEGGDIPDIVAQMADRRVYYSSRVDLVMDICKQVADDLWEYLFKGVSKGLSYPALNIPCCRNSYYEMYRKFFWILDKKRG